MEQYNILVADDEETFGEIFKDLLDNGKYNVVCAKNKTETLRKIMDFDIQVLLLDKRFPTDQDGLETLRKIKALKPEVEVILLTAYPDSDSNLEAIQNGAAAYLLKTSDYDKLLQTIEHLLEVIKLKKSNQKLMDELKEKNAKLQEARDAIRSWNVKLIQRLHDYEEALEKKSPHLSLTKIDRNELVTLALIQEINGQLRKSPHFLSKINEEKEFSLTEEFYSLSERINKIESITDDYFHLMAAKPEEKQSFSLENLLRKICCVGKMLCDEKKLAFQYSLPGQLTTLTGNQREIFVVLFSLLVKCVDAFPKDSKISSNTVSLGCLLQKGTVVMEIQGSNGKDSRQDPGNEFDPFQRVIENHGGSLFFGEVPNSIIVSLPIQQ